MDKQTELKRWMDIAETDLAAANHLVNNMYPAPYEITTGF
jgi:hypothetical protein